VWPVASARAPAAARLPPQDGARPRADLRHALRRGDSASQCEPPPRAAAPSRRPEPKPDGNGGDEHDGAKRAAGLDKSLQDAGWRQFLATLAYKAACAAKRGEAVSPASTAQDCSGGGERLQMSLRVRTQICTSGGLSVDRDENAAKNSFWRGQRLRGVPALAGAMNPEPVGL